MKRAAGFTLIELLVAISILAVVAVMGWRGLDGIVRARIALTDQMETTRGMQLAFAQMQSDCEHLASTPALLHQRPYLSADHDRLTIVRTVLSENEPPRLQVVAYRIRDGVLTRRESIGTRDLVQLDTLWQAAVTDADPTAPVVLQSGVTGMLIQVFEEGSWHVSTAASSAAAGGGAQLLVSQGGSGGAGGTGGGTGGSGGGVGSGPTPAPLLAPAPPAGLEIALQVRGQATSMTKVFLLGGT